MAAAIARPTWKDYALHGLFFNIYGWIKWFPSPLGDLMRALVARVFLAPGRSAVFAQYAFAVYPLATLAAGAEPIAVAARDYGHDPAAMRAAVRPNSRLRKRTSC